MLDVGSSAGITLGIERLEQLRKALLALLDYLLDQGTILGAKLLDISLDKSHHGNRLKLLYQRLLLGLFETVGVQKIGKLPLTVPLTALGFYARVQKILCDPWTTV